MKTTIEQLEEWLDSDEAKIDESVHYDADVDITDVNDKLWIELIGVRKGFEGFKILLRDKLNEMKSK